MTMIVSPKFYENTTLLWNKFDATQAIVDVEGVEYKSMQYYVHLNRRGRAQTRRDDFTCADLVKLLMALNYRDNAMLGICFGLLLECPVTWSSNRYVWQSSVYNKLKLVCDGSYPPSPERVIRNQEKSYWIIWNHYFEKSTTSSSEKCK